MIILPIALAIIIILGGAIVYMSIAKSMASALILLFMSESLLIKNINPDRRPDYIIKKCVKNKKAIPIVVRPLSMWYINNRGLGIATGFLRYIVNDLYTDENIELIH